VNSTKFLTSLEMLKSWR